MDSLAARGKTFDEVAELYERYRPGYPPGLAEDVIRLSGIPPGGNVVEVGSGTGKATLEFARRGYHITCLEPGANLARIAAKKLAEFPGVRVEVSAFEDWTPGAAGLDLAFAAQAFHFLEPHSALEKLGRALRPGGALAIFWNEPGTGAAELRERIDRAYTRHAPSLVRHRPGVPLDGLILESGQYEPSIVRNHPWQAVYTADEYVGLMRTQSDHNLLPAGQREALLSEIHEAIAGSGNCISLDYVTRLYLARRLAS